MMVAATARKEMVVGNPTSASSEMNLPTVKMVVVVKKAAEKAPSVRDGIVVTENQCSRAPSTSTIQPSALRGLALHLDSQPFIVSS